MEEVREVEGTLKPEEKCTIVSFSQEICRLKALSLSINMHFHLRGNIRVTNYEVS